MNEAQTTTGNFQKTGNIEGIEMQIGPHMMVVPPLNFKQLKHLQPRILAMQTNPNGMPEQEKLQLFLDICSQAIRRNYSNLTNDDLEEMLDLNNIGEVSVAVLNSSGLVRKADTLGKLMERLDHLSQMSSTGTSPTAPSSPTPDGPGNTLTIT